MSSLCCAGIFLEMSNPTTKWNSSISFLSQYKAESESSLSVCVWGTLVTEGKCIIGKEYEWMEYS